jgi:predicted amidohydrolase
MKKDLKVAIIQAEVPKSTELGEKQVERLVKEAVSKPIDLVGLSEDCVGLFKDIKKGYEPLKFLAKIARKYEINLFGATIIKDTDGKLYNAGFYFDKKGKLLQRHDKAVITPIEADDGIIPGKSLEVFDTEFGKMSILVCKDSFHRYAAWFFDAIRKAGVDVVLIPSYSLNISQRSVELWVDSLKALAKWFDVYIAAPGTIGENATQYPSFGHALIICPNRVILAEGSEDSEEILRATLDVKNLEEIRSTYGSKWQPSNVPEFELVEK